jgi:hypothetical protein
LGATLCIQIDRYQHIGRTCHLLQGARNFLIPNCQSTRCHFSKNSPLNINRCENLKYQYIHVATICNSFLSEVISGWAFLNPGRGYVLFLATTGVDRPWGALNLRPQAIFFPYNKELSAVWNLSLAFVWRQGLQCMELYSHTSTILYSHTSTTLYSHTSTTHPVRHSRHTGNFASTIAFWIIQWREINWKFCL